MPNTDTGLEGEIARHVSCCPLDAIPETARAAARRSVVDMLAAALAGRAADGIEAMVALVRGWGGTPQARLIGTGLRAPAPLAAWCNGAMARALELDDCIDALPLHPTAATLPALMATTDLLGGLSGAQFMRALAIGQDLYIRFGHAVTRNAMHSGRNNLFKLYAATATVTAAIGLDEDRTLNALGIASSYAVGDGQCALDGSMALRVQYGNVAQGAVQAGLLAAAGVTGPARFLTGKFGFFSSFEPEHDARILLDGLGKVFRGTQLSVKPYACCRVAHEAADLARALLASIGGLGDAAAITRIDVKVTPEVDRLTGAPRESKIRPTTGPGAQFSLQWVIASALLHDRLELADSAPEALRDEARLALAARVHVHPSADNRTGDVLGRTDMLVQFADGRTWSSSSDCPLGSPSRPVDMTFLRSKLAAAADHSGQRVAPDRLDALVSAARRLESLEDARVLLDPVA